MIGDHQRESHSAGAAVERRTPRPACAFDSYQCGRSQPAVSKNTAPSAFSRAWNGGSRTSRFERPLLAGMDDAVGLVEALGGARAHVLRASSGSRRSARCPTTEVDLATRRASSTRRPPGRRPAPPSPTRRRRTTGPSTSGVSPSSGSPSGVSDSRPLIAYLMPTLSSPTISGISSSACSIWSAKSSSVNGNSVGDSAASSIEGISLGVVQDRAVRVRADLQAGAVLALVHVRVHVAHDRELDRPAWRRRSAAPGRCRSSGGSPA